MAENCISRERMAFFLEGELPPFEEDTTIMHLEECETCEHLASTLADEPSARAMLSPIHVSERSTSDDSLVQLKGPLPCAGPLWRHQWQALMKQLSADTSQASAAAGGGQPSGPIALPQRFGKFEILRELGSGGFGIVYLAIDSILGRQVALKFPRHSILADSESRRRFFREAQALARLDHPHIVPAYEAGEHEGTCYLAVAYCDGPTLQEWQADQQRPIEPKTAAQIVLCLAEAVEHAHQHDILHRDIKPANVLLSAAPAGGELPLVPRLVDFGLARIADGERMGITVSGAVLGTPHYLAPEQAAGMNECVGRATDVYGLGAVLYELLTGQPPIRGANTTDTLRRILMDKPVPPGRLNRAVPSLLNSIVMKCLAKSTTSRYGAAPRVIGRSATIPRGASATSRLRASLDDRHKSARPLVHRLEPHCTNARRHGKYVLDPS